jgi:hypothetical protein
MRRLNTGLFFIVFSMCCTHGVVGCGQLKLGVLQLNDPAPVGTIVAQGTFNGLNGKTVSGVAVIYRLTETGTHVIRLEGINTPAESGLLVRARQGGQVVFDTGLRSTRGTQNYSINITESAGWNSVTIHSTAANEDYATALFDSE